MTERRYFCRLFDIVGKMKGHVGGGPGSGVFKAPGARTNQAVLTCLRYALCIFVQERLLEVSCSGLAHSGGVGVEHQT